MPERLASCVVTYVISWLFIGAPYSRSSQPILCIFSQSAFNL